MLLTDLMSEAQWQDFQKNIFDRTGLNVSIFDSNGTLFLNYPEWSNKLCPVIKNHQKGREIICINANNNISLIAKKSKKTVIEECDAGLLKFAVPVYSDYKHLGTISCCGLLAEEVEVDTFLIHKLTGIEEAELKKNSSGIGIISEEKINSIIKYIENELGN